VRAQLLNQATSRRAFLGGAAATAAAVAAQACFGGGDSNSSATPVPEGTPQPGGTLKTGIFFDPDNLDPAQGGFAFIVFQRLYSYLHHIDGRTLEYIPDVATTVEQPDELTYIFNLREDVRFHDIPPAGGRAITAHDVAFSFNRLTEVLNPIDPGFMSRVVDRAEAVGDATFKVTTKRPYASALQVMGGYWYAIVNREAVTAWGGLSDRALGSGPFMLDTYEQERGATLRKNPAYYKAGQPYLEGLDVTVIADNTNALAQFRSKALDVNSAPLTKPEFDALTRELDVRSSVSPGILDPWVGLNLRRRPWTDARVREAFDLAIDRKQMIRNLAFGEGKLNGPIPWGNERWALPQDELEDFYRTDKQQAKQLLEAAGITSLELTHRVTPALPLGKEIGEFMKEQLKDLGISVNISVHEQNDWIQTTLLKQDFDTCGFAWFPVLDPTVSLRFVDRDDIFSGLIFGFDDDEIASLYQRMQAEFETEARKLAMWDLQRAVLRFHGPVLHMFDGYGYSLWHPWVHNWRPENTELNWYNSEIWLSQRT
jgi:peptide/nickel transport system substrate-binding protein/glutathione transport system substrate-binding protein